MINNDYAVEFQIAHETIQYLIARTFTEISKTDDEKKVEELFKQVDVYMEQEKKIGKFDIDTIQYVINNYCPRIKASIEEARKETKK